MWPIYSRCASRHYCEASRQFDLLSSRCRCRGSKRRPGAIIPNLTPRPRELLLSLSWPVASPRTSSTVSRRQQPRFKFHFRRIPPFSSPAQRRTGYH
jgi:hypothetical protein